MKPNWKLTDHAEQRVKERLPDRDVYRLLGIAKRLTDEQKKRLVRENPQAMKQVQGQFTGRYFLISANRFIFVIEPPSLVITCWDWYAGLRCSLEELDFLERRKPRNGQFHLNTDEFYGLINAARGAISEE